jgi:hypothetical protein
VPFRPLGSVRTQAHHSTSPPPYCGKCMPKLGLQSPPVFRSSALPVPACCVCASVCQCTRAGLPHRDVSTPLRMDHCRCRAAPTSPRVMAKLSIMTHSPAEMHRRAKFTRKRGTTAGDAERRVSREAEAHPATGPGSNSAACRRCVSFMLLLHQTLFGDFTMVYCCSGRRVGLL